MRPHEDTGNLRCTGDHLEHLRVETSPRRDAEMAQSSISQLYTGLGSQMRGTRVMKRALPGSVPDAHLFCFSFGQKELLDGDAIN